MHASVEVYSLSLLRIRIGMEKLVCRKNVIALFREKKIENHENAGGLWEDNVNFEKRGFIAMSQDRSATYDFAEWDRSESAPR